MICHVCGEKLGESSKGMDAHMKRYHAVTITQPKPKFRPKAEVVAEWEANHPEFFVGVGPECHEDCKCNRCFQKALDRLVASSEVAANDIGNGLGLNNELASDELQKRPSTNGQYTIQHGYGS